jgi:hypothetical protein
MSGAQDDQWGASPGFTPEEATGYVELMILAGLGEPEPPPAAVWLAQGRQEGD